MRTGFLTTIWTMSGCVLFQVHNINELRHLLTTYNEIRYDAPFHLSEECSNANIASPRAIVMTAQFGLYMGWAIILVD